MGEKSIAQGSPLGSFSRPILGMFTDGSGFVKLGKVSSLSSQAEQCPLLKACVVSLASAMNLGSAHAGSTVAPGSGDRSVGRKQSCVRQSSESPGA